MTRLMIVMTYDDYQYGHMPSYIYVTDAEDEDKEYCRLMREEYDRLQDKSDKYILDEALDQWEIREV